MHVKQISNNPSSVYNPVGVIKILSYWLDLFSVLLFIHKKLLSTDFILSAQSLPSLSGGELWTNHNNTECRSPETLTMSLKPSRGRRYLEHQQGSQRKSAWPVSCKEAIIPKTQSGARESGQQRAETEKNTARSRHRRPLECQMLPISEMGWGGLNSGIWCTQENVFNQDSAAVEFCTGKV